MLNKGLINVHLGLHSTTGALEAAHALVYGEIVSLSEQQLVDCAGAFDNQVCTHNFNSDDYTIYTDALTSTSMPITSALTTTPFTQMSITSTSMPITSTLMTIPFYTDAYNIHTDAHNIHTNAHNINRVPH